MIKSDRFAIICETKSFAVIFLHVGGDFESPRIMKFQTKVCIFIITQIENIQEVIKNFSC